MGSLKPEPQSSAKAKRAQGFKCGAFFFSKFGLRLTRTRLPVQGSKRRHHDVGIRVRLGRRVEGVE